MGMGTYVKMRSQPTPHPTQRMETIFRQLVLIYVSNPTSAGDPFLHQDKAIKKPTMFTAITTYLHSWLDYGLALCKMAKNREVGWITIDRKVAAPVPSSLP